MGVRGRKKSRVEELEEQVRGMRMEIDELKRAGRNDGDDSCSDTEYDAASSRPQRVSAQRASRRRRAPSESDDEEPIPEYESSPILVVLFYFDAC